jgi:hypothetical protein
VHQGLTNQHAAFHAARERTHVGVGLPGQVEVGKDLVDPVVVVAQAKIASLEAQRFAHREEGIEHKLLRDDTEAAARVAVAGDDIVSHHRRGAAVGAGQSPRGC